MCLGLEMHIVSSRPAFRMSFNQNCIWGSDKKNVVVGGEFVWKWEIAFYSCTLQSCQLLELYNSTVRFYYCWEVSQIAI